jgi:hypothetical protein
LATRPLLTQLDRTARIEVDDVERVLANIDANHRDFTSVTDLPHSQTKGFAGKKKAGAATKRAADRYLNEARKK